MVETRHIGYLVILFIIIFLLFLLFSALIERSIYHDDPILFYRYGIYWYGKKCRIVTPMSQFITVDDGGNLIATDMMKDNTIWLYIFSDTDNNVGTFYHIQSNRYITYEDYLPNEKITATLECFTDARLYQLSSQTADFVTITPINTGNINGTLYFTEKDNFIQLDTYDDMTSQFLLTYI